MSAWGKLRTSNYDWPVVGETERLLTRSHAMLVKSPDWLDRWSWVDPLDDGRPRRWVLADHGLYGRIVSGTCIDSNGI